MIRAEHWGRERPYHGAVKRDMTGFVQAGGALAVLTALGWLAGCSDNPGGPGPGGPPARGVIVSDPVHGAGLAPALRGAQVLANRVEDGVVYVSLAPGTVPTGSRARINRVGDASAIATAVLDGGFDPVPVEALVGDSIEVRITDANNGTLLEARYAVGLKRPPVVLRTDPGRGKTDVAINASIVIVFSEPIAAGTLTSSSVQLFHGTNVVAGTVSLLQGTAAAAVLTPSAPLDPNTAYRLIVRTTVRDLTGDALLAEAVVDFTTGTTAVSPANSVSVVPETTTLPVGSQVQLIAVAHDSLGLPVTGRPVVWSSDNPAAASVSVTGLVTALAPGETRVRAEVDGRSGAALIQVSGVLAPPASVDVTPASATVLAGGLVQLSAVLRDAGGNILPFRAVTWQSGAPAVAEVSGGSGGKALVTGISAGTVTITATSGGKSATATITVGTVGPYAQISAGGVQQAYACALITDARVWCWGPNGDGGLGNGTIVSSSVPTAVTGGLAFSQISHSCALTADGAAYCWGSNVYGRLGIGRSTGPEDCPSHGPCSTSPVAVAGGLRFGAIAVGELFDCALTQTGDAYCWGDNTYGELGVGTKTGPENCGGAPCSTAPARVIGGSTFTSLTVGRSHACALTASGAAYCWGENWAGQLGDGTTSDRLSPVLVAGGHAFAALAAGYAHTCAVTSDGTAYCWGWNASGQLGAGTTAGLDSCGGWACARNPVPVAGALGLVAIRPGAHHTCAVTPAGVAYCWGANLAGQLGNGTIDGTATPVAVAGGHVFASLDAGAESSCGVTTTGIAYCWGGNTYGQLGDGTMSNRSVPVRVAGQQ